MLSLPTILSAFLAGQIATAAYIPLPLSLLARHEEDDVVTVTRIISLTSYVAPAPTPTSKKSTTTLTRTLQKTLYTTVKPKLTSTEGLNPINGLPVPFVGKSSSASIATPKSIDPPVSLTATYDTTAAPPNSTAKPSMYKTKALTSSATTSFQMLSETPTSAKSTATLSSENPYPYPTTKKNSSFSSHAPSPSSSSSGEVKNPYPYPTPTKKSSSSETSKSTKAKSTATGENPYPYPTQESSKTSSSAEPKETKSKDKCAYPYPGCEDE